MNKNRQELDEELQKLIATRDTYTRCIADMHEKIHAWEEERSRVFKKIRKIADHLEKHADIIHARFDWRDRELNDREVHTSSFICMYPLRVLEDADELKMKVVQIIMAEEEIEDTPENLQEVRKRIRMTYT